VSTVTTHVLDTALGRPGWGIRATLERDGTVVGTGVTDEQGRISEFRPAGVQLERGSYRLIFAVAEYWRREGREAFYPEIVVHFVIGSDTEHYHVPLLLSPFGYTTYRGS
jgi:5-hydroxyisourate hydrolase